ncbi:MAG: hypothetical protein AAFW97_15710 [Pseudomonadota bacterium]
MRARSLWIASLSGAILCLPVGPASAQEPEPETGTVYRLSPEEIAEVQNPERQRLEELALAENQLRERSVSGVIGFGIGTGGYRTIFGSAFVPLGNTGFLALAFENARYGNRTLRRNLAPHNHHR